MEHQYLIPRVMNKFIYIITSPLILLVTCVAGVCEEVRLFPRTFMETLKDFDR